MKEQGFVKSLLYVLLMVGFLIGLLWLTTPFSFATSEPIMCDANHDGKINIDDIRIMFYDYRNVEVDAGSQHLDVNGDGWITINDARGCVLLCDNPRCAP